jgi:hypothetical protein
MYRKIFFLFFLTIVSISCRHSDSAKQGHGTITYRVSYPESNKYGVKAYLFPREITLVFKDDKAAFIASGGLGMVQLVNLLNYKNQKYISLLIDEIHGNYACTLSEEEIKKNENNPRYQISETGETKTIAGIQSKKAIVNDLTNNKSFEIYYDDKIKFWYWNSPFKDFNYLFTEYTHTINGLTMKLEAINVDFSSPVDTALFNVKGNYIWVNQSTFFSHLSQM